MIHYKISEIRKALNLSTDFLASQLRLPVDLYVDIDNGKVDLKLSKLFLIADVLNVFPSDLFVCIKMNNTKKNDFNVHYKESKKCLSYIPFSDTLKHQYILKLKEDNKILREMFL